MVMLVALALAILIIGSFVVLVRRNLMALKAADPLPHSLIIKHIR
jgi:multisubunit Na+/H+ antiporter MnhC subunit